MTGGILTSRKTKSELHKKSLLNPARYNLTYKNYRNIYNKVVKASKQMYLEESFKKYQSNPKKTWDLLKETALNKSNVNTFSSEFFDNGVTVTESQDIANGFNSFFANIGTTIRDSVQNVEIKPESYAPDYNYDEKPCFELEEISSTWITDIVKSFDNKSSPDLDGLSLAFIKQIIHYIATPLSYVHT